MTDKESFARRAVGISPQHRSTNDGPVSVWRTKQSPTDVPIGRYEHKRRRAAAGVLVAVMLVTLFGMASLCIDVGTLYQARADLQKAADSAAMAAAWELFDEDRLTGSPSYADDIAAARASASDYARRNPVLNRTIAVEGADITIGYLRNPRDPSATLSFANPVQFNAVHVLARKDSVRNGPVDLYFQMIFGRSSSEVTASAMAAFEGGVVGFEVPPGGTADILPFALHVDVWNGILDGTWPTSDDWAYGNGSVNSGSDGVSEVNMYPGAGTTQLPPGNFGTVDIGASGNSSADLARQIVDGVNSEDLAYHGGALKLGEDGTLLLNGDTGLSAGIKDELASIIGQPRTIPLFDFVELSGNNAMYRIVGFAGIRIMEVELTGAPNRKRVVIQPSFFVDPSAITDPNASGPGDFVYKSVLLVR